MKFLSVDKQLHFLVGTSLAGVLFISTDNLLLTVGGVVLAGALKEIRDSMGYGTPEMTDLLYTVLGVFPILCAQYIGKYYAA